MAIYHAKIKVISRGDGSSAVGAAAYRAGEKLKETKEVMEFREKRLPRIEKQVPKAQEKLAEVQKEMESLNPESNEWKKLYKDMKKHERKINAYERQKKSDGKYDYSKKKGIIHSEIITPDNAPDWMQDRQKLWNAAEVAEEDRINGRVAREAMVAIPHELTEQQQIELTKKFGEWISDRYNVAVDFAVHEPHFKHADERNIHAHIMFTVREVTSSGLGARTELLNGKKTIGGQEIKTIRAKWEQFANDALADSGSLARIDNRSLEEKGEDRIPRVHMGKTATALERKGIETIKGQELHRIEHSNSLNAYANAHLSSEEAIRRTNDDIAQLDYIEELEQTRDREVECGRKH